MTHLRKMMLEELQRRHYASEATTRYYIRAVERFAQHFHCSPDRLGRQHIREYQAQLFTVQKLSPGTVTNHLCALRFFYIQTLKRPWSITDTPYPKKTHRLPTILSQEEVAQLIDAACTPFHRTILMTLYATGVRDEELTRLKVSDIDSRRMVIHIQGGKGRQDRDVMLSPVLLDQLRAHWRQLRKKSSIWLFPGNRWHTGARPIDTKTPRHACQYAARRAGIREEGLSPPAPSLLRHASAGSRRRPAYHPDPVRPSRSERDRSLSPSFATSLARYRQSTGHAGVERQVSAGGIDESAALRSGRPDPQRRNSFHQAQPQMDPLDPYQGPAGHLALPHRGTRRVISMSAPAADIVPPSPITVAAIAIAQSVRRALANAGSRHDGANCSPRPTSMSCSPCRRNWQRWPYRIKRSSIVCCCGPAQKRFWRWRGTPHIWGLRSDSSACYIPGTRNSRFILMSTALFPPAGSRSITPAGFDLTRASSSPFPCCGRCFAASSSTLSRTPFSMASCTFPAIWRRSRNPNSSLPGYDRCFAKTGWSTRNHPSAAPTMCSSISAVTPTASPSPTIDWYRWPTDQVTFRWRDSADHNQQKLMTVSLDKFLRRFLLHLLPKGFVRIRHFGFLANRRRSLLLPLCFAALGTVPAPREPETSPHEFAPSLALPQVWRTDGGHRTTYRSSNPTPFSTTVAHNCNMKPLPHNSKTLHGSPRSAPVPPRS